jgi:hypothetical protein
MNTRVRLRLAIPLLLAFLAITFFAPNAVAQSHEWQFEAGIYGWLPTINGELSYYVPELGDKIKVDPGTLLDNLQFTAMIAAAANYHKWSVFADFIYLNEAKKTSTQLDVGGGLQLEADFKLKSVILNPGVAYRVAGHTNTSLSVLVGARYFYANTSLGLKASGPLTADTTVEQSTHVWNVVAGASGRIGLSKWWFIPYHLDIGTGASDFTWQGVGGISYNWKWGGVVLAYRYLSFDQGSDEQVRKLSFGGPELGVGFRF